MVLRAEFRWRGSSHAQDVMQEKWEVAQRGDGQDESEDDEQTTDIGGFRLAVQKWHRGHSTRNGRREIGQNRTRSFGLRREQGQTQLQRPAGAAVIASHLSRANAARRRWGTRRASGLRRRARSTDPHLLTAADVGHLRLLVAFHFAGFGVVVETGEQFDVGAVKFVRQRREWG